MEIREARPEELDALGQLLVAVYAGIEGFPGPKEQPEYYALLANVGRLQRADTLLLVAIGDDGALLGGVVYFSEMTHYGASEVAMQQRETSAFRLLAVDPAARGFGVAKALVGRCLALARARGHRQVVIHTTAAQSVAWAMYERLGFVHAPELDFTQQGFPIVGFRLAL